MNMKRFLSFFFCLIIAASCVPNSASQTSKTIIITDLPTLTIGEPLPYLQKITVMNVDQLRPFRSMKIPDYERGKISQCNTEFNSDGTLITAACGINSVPIWNVESGEVVSLFDTGDTQMVSCVFSPDGMTLACGGFNGKVMLWDVKTGTAIKDLANIQSPIWEIAFTPDGKNLATCGINDSIRLWNVESGDQIWITDEMEECLSLAFDPAGKVIAYGGMRGEIGIINADDGNSITVLDELKYPVGDVAFNHAGTMLAAGCDDDTIYLWNTGDLKSAEDYAFAMNLKGHYNYVNGIAFSPDDSLMISDSHDSSTHIWNTATLKTVKITGEHSDVILRGSFNPQGTLIATVSWDGKVSLFGIR